MRATIEIDMDNDAFDQYGRELKEILLKCANLAPSLTPHHCKVKCGSEDGSSEVLRDSNGNPVGLFEVTR